MSQAAIAHHTTPMSCTCDDWKFSDSYGYRCDHMKNLGKPVAQPIVRVSIPSPAFSALEFEIASQAKSSRCGARIWAYIELHGTLDDLADSEWKQYATESEVSYKTLRAEVLRALCDRFDTESGFNISVPLDDRLAIFYHGYIVNR